MENGNITEHFSIIKNSGKKISIENIGCGNVIATIASLTSGTYEIEHIGQDNIILSRREFHEDYPEKDAEGEKAFYTFPIHSIKLIKWETFDPAKEE